jgi:hypothetical protein
LEHIGDDFCVSARNWLDTPWYRVVEGVLILTIVTMVIVGQPTSFISGVFFFSMLFFLYATHLARLEISNLLSRVLFSFDTLFFVMLCTIAQALSFYQSMFEAEYISPGVEYSFHVMHVAGIVCTGCLVLIDVALADAFVLVPRGWKIGVCVQIKCLI